MYDKRILVCSISAWNKKTGSDTFSSLMDTYGAEKVANVYFSESAPDSPVCGRYFRISENSVVKSLLKRSIKTGSEVIVDTSEDDNTENERITAARYKRFSGKRNYVLLLAREMIWKMGRWKTPELLAFVDDFKPDVVFFSMEGYIYHNRVCRYILKRTGARGVGYFWDDNFTYKQSRRFMHNVYRFFQRKSLKKTAKLCQEFFAISPKTKAEADAYFKIDCQLLTKPVAIDPNGFVAYQPHKPIKMLYTGKLVIGRLETVMEIGRALDEINRDSVKMELDVYTTTELNEEQQKTMSPYVHLLGAIPQNEVAAKQEAADVLLFAEAISGEHSKTARLSFSTKLTDYFRAGKCILAVGDRETAPMEYLIENDAAFVAWDRESILKCLLCIQEKPTLVSEYAERAYRCGVMNHEATTIKKRLFDTLNG